MRREWVITGRYTHMAAWELIDSTEDMSAAEAEQYVIDTYPELQEFEIIAKETVYRVERRTTWHQA